MTRTNTCFIHPLSGEKNSTSERSRDDSAQPPGANITSSTKWRKQIEKLD